MSGNALRAAARFLALLAIAATAVGAQSDVIRGRITAPDGTPVSRATVEATAATSKLSRSARSGADGRFTLVMPGDEGDYVLSVTALGFQPRRVQLKRGADEDVLIADITMTRVALSLGTTSIRAPRPRARRNDTALDASGTERPLESDNILIADLGDLSAMTASLLGVQLTPGADPGVLGFSVMGLGPEANALALNGLPGSTTTVPRDAAVTSTLVTTPYDVARGGFAGGQILIRTRPGSNVVTRTSSLVLDSPRAQWLDQSSRLASQGFSQFSASGLASGAFVPDRAFYSLSYEVRRRSDEQKTLMDLNAAALRDIGISSDSSQRLLSIMGRSGLPSLTGGSRIAGRVAVLGSFDMNAPASTSGHAIGASFALNLDRTANTAGSPVELATRRGTFSRSDGTFQFRHTNYFRMGVLTETSMGVSLVKYDLARRLEAPAANIRIASEFSDAAPAVQVVAAGGGAATREDASGSIALRNQLSWISQSNHHRFRLTTELQRELSRQYLAVNDLGTFSYASLADLEMGQPSSFTRSLDARRRAESRTTGSLSLGDSYRPRTNIQLQYGLRVDASRFSVRPAANRELQAALDVDNSALPRGLYVSPRFGFTWTAPASAATDETGRDLPRPVIRGGIGIFQGLTTNADVSPVLDNTGLSDGVRQLVCVGQATPAANWAAMMDNRGSIPTLCADGSGAAQFSNGAPNVALFDHGFRPPRSLRLNLQWNGGILRHRLLASVDAALSLNQFQPSNFDINLDGRPRFFLHSEADRPVFVSQSAIVATSGLLAWRESRTSSFFGHVTSRRSDLHSLSKQVTVRLQPRNPSAAFSWYAGYVYSRTTELASGFFSTAGSPLAAERSRSAFDVRHQIQYALSHDLMGVARVTWFGTLGSGRPYTPLVAGDVNGDGYWNDRAFIFSADRGGDSALAAGVQALTRTAPAGARRCLLRQQGRLAARNSCEGPWTASATLNATVNLSFLGVSPRATLSFQVSNPLGAADLLLHATSRLRGWGQMSSPSQQLLFVRGFDPAAERFKYEINSRFGSNSMSAALRTPVALTLIVRLDIAPSYERQALTRELDRGRRTQGPLREASTLKSMFGPSTVPNPIATLLMQAGEFSLSSAQADSLAAMQRSFALQIDSIWTPVSRDLASLPAVYDQSEAFRRYQAAWASSIDRLLLLTPSVRAVLTPSQYGDLPRALRRLMDDRQLRSIRSNPSMVRR